MVIREVHDLPPGDAEGLHLLEDACPCGPTTHADADDEGMFWVRHRPLTPVCYTIP